MLLCFLYPASHRRKKKAMIGEKLKELRIKKGIPAAALDERFGLMRGHWMNWENGFSEPEPELLDEIAEYFGVNVKELEEKDNA